ncbi:MAG: LysM peptidoglycan-binding domain-containing protein [Bacilli bacterium]
MNCIIPFTKNIKFKTSIAEVLSISLEHEYTINESELLGNFVVTGSYKTHEVSVNKDPFEFVLPFSVNLTNPVDISSIDFEIEDFTYEVIDKDTLKVDIEYRIKATDKEEEKKEIFERIDESTENDEYAENIIDAFVDERSKEEEDELMNNKRDNVSEKDKLAIMDTLTEDEDTFVTYHIHVLRENETIETVCNIYNTNINIIENYNDIKNINIGDKIIIPDIDE